MTDLTTTDTILPPVRQHVAEMTRALIERKANGTQETARTQIGKKASVSIHRAEDGKVTLHLHDGFYAAGSGFMASDRELALAAAEALNAFADALDAPAAEAGR